jgi:hypothetical protein
MFVACCVVWGAKGSVSMIAALLVLSADLSLSTLRRHPLHKLLFRSYRWHEMLTEEAFSMKLLLVITTIMKSNEIEL